MKILILLTSLFALCACVGDSEVKESVKRALNDPESARFTDLKPGKKQGDVCGFVNAKNRMGGYVGETPFVYIKTSGAVSMVSEVAQRDFRMLWSSIQAGNYSDDVDKLRNQCAAIDQWNAACTTQITKYEMCSVFQGSGMALYKELEAVFNR